MPTLAPMPATLCLNANDSVVIATRDLSQGEALTELGLAASGVVRSSVPSGHKLAISSIRRGDPIFKYGQVIGVASRDVEPGDHVHTHNLCMSDLRNAAPAATPSGVEAAPNQRSFRGYRRTRGRAGTRNYVAVVASVNCSATVVRAIVEQAERSGMMRAYANIDGLVALTHNSGCAIAGAGESYDMLRRTLWGTAANPNIGGALFVGLGCEVVQANGLLADSGLAGEPGYAAITIQGAGGTRAAITEGVRALAGILEAVDQTSREDCPVSDLVLGLQCGGSDSWSGLTCNPALGNAADRLIALGGTVLLSETPEVVGAEHLLIARAAAPEIAEKLHERIAWWKAHTAIHGVSLDNNPSPGNIAGGLTTILEKSLGAVAKGGSMPLVDVIRYAEPVRRNGFIFMDSPGFDPCSATGQIATGATLIAFTTGRGSAFGARPSPSIKLASNSEIYRRMPDDMDIDCGPILTGEASIAEVGEAILEFLIATASGRPSKSETLGYGNMEFVPWLTGATL